MEVSKDLLNHPLAIVAIMSVILGFLGMAIREFFWFMKSLNGNTPTDKMGAAFEKLGETLTGVTKSLDLLNHKIEHAEELNRIRSERILDEIKSLKGK